MVEKTNKIIRSILPILASQDNSIEWDEETGLCINYQESLTTPEIQHEKLTEYGKKQFDFNHLKYEDVVSKELSVGAVINKEFIGFDKDYLAVHCLIKVFSPKNFIEIGCNSGMGTYVIANAMSGENVISVDLPEDKHHLKNVGKQCSLPFTLIRCDTLKYNFSQHMPIDGWLIDGVHDYEHVRHETLTAIIGGAKLIIWHDVGLVKHAIIDVMSKVEDYTTYLIEGTRIAYAVLASVS